MSYDLTSYVINYYKKKGKEALILHSPMDILRVMVSDKSKAVISDCKMIRGMAKLKGMERSQYETIADVALQFFAFEDALGLLAKKGVPVYFYNRIGKEKKGYRYTEKEEYRMKKGLSFPKMYQNINGYARELNDIFGKLYSQEYVTEIGKIPQVIKIGNLYQHENYRSKYINVVNGKRITCGQPNNYKKTIHVYGRCGVFGYAVEDKDNIPSLLQRELLEHGFTDIRVVNHGLWGGEDTCLDHNFLQESVGMKEGDIVLFYRSHFDKKLIAELEKYGLRYKEITHEWHRQRDKTVTFYDKPGHMNADGYKLVAKLICEDLINTGFSGGTIYSDNKLSTAEHLNYYLKTKLDDNFEKEIREYIKKIIAEYPLDDSLVNNGAVVMNCNPFTKGHRYLIETSAKQVDRLYIFVVEEDKSYFKFKDRFEMVRKGVEDLRNVVVVPSGKFIISALTFPEYFMKDYVKEKNFDVSTDVETFCKYIAPPLNIRVRFAGEEPFDPVTKNYNENMNRILPMYGLKFVEIPRLAIDNSRIINATKVREFLKDKKLEELKEYVPESTFSVLVKQYIN